MRKPVVVDTNVLVVANGGPEHSRICAANCARRLKRIRENSQVILDTGHEILQEYLRHQPQTSQPGAGYYFLKWLLSKSASMEHCTWVTITPDSSRGYCEFPDHEGLRTFDPADRKFVAVSVAHGKHPPILQATDSKWVGWKDALAECGIKVEFLCAREIRRKYEEKIGRKAK